MIELQHGSFGEYSVAEGSARACSLPSAGEMSKLDRETIEHGTSGCELMERAGKAIAERVVGAFSGVRSAVVLCGPGNNGGDGLVIARTLRERGVLVHIIVVSAERYSGECEQQIQGTADLHVFGGLASWTGADGMPPRATTPPEVRSLIAASDLVIDALLGTGQREAPRARVAELIEIVRCVQSAGPRCRVVAVDIPTGIDSDTGSIYTPHIAADRTVTVQCIKRGMLQFPARTACGVIESVDVGISGKTPVEYSLVAAGNLPRMVSRAPDTHKGLLGRTLVVGGSLAMPGAPMLSALAALRTGAGIVSRCVRSGWSTIPPLPEAMYEVCLGDAATFQPQDIAPVTQMVERYDVFVLGPGLGTDPGTAQFVVGVIEVLKLRGARVVIDADALNIIATTGVTLKGLAAVVTPHPGEAARLLGITSSEVQRDRFRAARELSRALGVIAVLKGAGSLIHDGAEGRLVAEGTPYLATPGSGDVLAGIIAACAARTASLWEAAVLGVWIHARAGAAAAEQRGGPILASEVCDSIGHVIGRLEEGRLA